MTNNYLIYKHTSPRGKSYIGQTKDIQRRNIQHRGTNICPAFAAAIKKYGWDNFSHEILYENLTLEEANHLEEYFIEKHKTLAPNGYNLKSGGLNHIPSDETRVKMSISRKKYSHTPETYAKVSAAHTGKKKSPEAVAKSATSRKGMKPTPESTAKRIVSLTGRKLSPEHIAKRSATRTGVKQSAETVAKRALSLKGKTPSATTRTKMAIAQTGKKQSLETIAKRAATRQKNKILKLSSV